MVADVICAPRLYDDTAPSATHTLSLRDALPICQTYVLVERGKDDYARKPLQLGGELNGRSEEHTSELQSLRHLVCRLLLAKKPYCHFRSDVDPRPGMGFGLRRAG